MKAEIILMNPTRGMIVARSDEVGFVIFELLGDYSPEIGDVVSHSDFSSKGSEKYRNVTQREDMDVYVEGIVGTIGAAKKRCSLQ